MKLIYKCRLKVILHDKINLFWTLVFPILLATLFSISFGSALQNSEAFESIPIAVVEEVDATPYFSEMITALDKEGVLKVKNVSIEEAENLLDNEDIVGIYLIGNTISLNVNNSGISQSILKEILNSYLQIESTIANIAKDDPSVFEKNPELLAGIISNITNDAPVTEEVNQKSNLNYFFQNYYALIAMTCLYGSFFGISAALSLQGNLSALGARRNVAPTSKAKLALGDMLANLTIVFFVITIFLIYINVFLKVEMGDNIPAVLLTGFLGSFVGVMLGMAIGSLSKLSASIKEGILIGGILFLSFLGGMMYPMIRYNIENTVPIINKINPAALIVDALYSLDTYGLGGRFWSNILILAFIGVVLFIISIGFLRRREYESV